jgi:putative hydrolase of the HAD superfamily
MISTLLFDLGGVVCRYDPSERLALLGADSGLDPDEVHRRVWASSLSSDFELGRYTTQEWFQLVRETLGLRMDDARLLGVILTALTIDPDVLAIVDRLRTRVRTAMLTDNPPLLLEVLPTHFPEIAPRFDPFLISCELGLLKPSREIFEAALARLGEAPEAVLFVDDMEANVLGARACGIEAVQFTSASALRADLVCYGVLDG